MFQLIYEKSGTKLADGPPKKIIKNFFVIELFLINLMASLNWI